MEEWVGQWWHKAITRIAATPPNAERVLLADWGYAHTFVPGARTCMVFNIQPISNLSTITING